MTASDTPLQRDTRAVVLRTLLLDAVAARSAGLLAERGVPCILLKGRVLANWLYADEVRDYGDVDLLVPPALRDDAVDVLGSVGYRHRLAGAAPAEYGTNELELVGPNGVCIDLHHTLLGVPAAQCWAVLSQHTEQMTVGGRSLTVLAPGARALHLALHVAQNGPVDVKAVHDLELGLARLPLDLWRDARDLAEAAGATPAFAAGLYAVEAGGRLAGRLDLLPPRDVALQLRTTSAPQQALQIQNFVEAGSLRSRAGLVARKLWPTRIYMLGRLPAARAGTTALLTARLRRLAGLPHTFFIAFRSWYRAMRAVRALPAGHVHVGHEKELV